MGRPRSLTVEKENDEIKRLTGHTPTKAYSKWKNEKIQENIAEMSIEASKRHMTYGQLQAEKYAARMSFEHKKLH